MPWTSRGIQSLCHDDIWKSDSTSLFDIRTSLLVKESQLDIFRQEIATTTVSAIFAQPSDSQQVDSTSQDPQSNQFGSRGRGRNVYCGGRGRGRTGGRFELPIFPQSQNLLMPEPWFPDSGATHDLTSDLSNL
ncbi:hypothetical protein A2U01_0024766 [Trifolium medium]|uniref:Uncharacterized protein n=1 Tax=Trifolium medium TaxID=97028 RepID=A0A392NYZ4_9FABA|nr:hypothetical protein [Trifolium medium]